jgi:hypothetical protein
MLDPTRRVVLEEVPHVTVYGDHEASTSFYVTASSPRLAQEESGKPSINLLVYFRRGGSVKAPSGGRLVLTTSLGLTPEELEQTREALAKRRRDDPATVEIGQRPQPIELRFPQWVRGTAEVTIGELVRLTGQPSLAGENVCTMSTALNAEQAQALHAHWRDGLPQARIVYHLVMRGVAVAGSQFACTATSEAHRPGGELRTLSTLAMDVEMTQGVEHPLTVEGPLITPGTALASQLHEMSL